MKKIRPVSLCLIMSLVVTGTLAQERVSRSIAETLLLYQRDNGAWPKNFDWKQDIDEQQEKELLRQKGRNDTTIDNGATYQEIRYLARAYTRFKDKRYRRAVLKGVTSLLQAQYPNGGWPQFFPRASGYHRHITFNDNAMIGAMSLLRDIARADPEFGFVDNRRREQAQAAVVRGIDCILKCQVVVRGKQTVWCAQHDENTLAPCGARSYELASLSGAESVNIVRFLMAIEHPQPEVIEAIESAVAWFEQAEIKGKRVKTIPAPDTPRGRDRVVVSDPAAPPLWARFYEIETNRPFFCSRDGIPRYRLAEISYERRNGYSWLGRYADRLLTQAYPAWQKRQNARP